MRPCWVERCGAGEMLGDARTSKIFCMPTKNKTENKWTICRSIPFHRILYAAVWFGISFFLLLMLSLLLFYSFVFVWFGFRMNFIFSQRVNNINLCFLSSKFSIWSLELFSSFRWMCVCEAARFAHNTKRENWNTPTEWILNIHTCIVCF